MKREYTEAVKKANRTWDSNNLDRISVALPKGQRDIIKAHAESMGESTNKFIQRAINETIERDKKSSPEA